ncbi:hypothetical protein HDF26_004485 [Pedobacter cryoconitis]|uniref:hypothetical protein n=1 Tax=Pedobacter cryoconitis TaxID=188932 RepID=UPI00161AC51A|nr:hypothetical protein [Pedobacter cryoconitis]MBB6274012.1 hypothetical protein [Pedobacter cryoconitis]
MRRYYYILIAVLCVTACKAHNRKEDRDSLLKQNIVRNKVRFIKSYKYEYKSGALDSNTRSLANSEEYDQQGNLITRLTYLAKDYEEYLPIDSTINVFDQSGNLLKSTEIKYEVLGDSKDSINRYVKVFKNVYVNNKITESHIYRDGVLQSKTKPEYTTDGKVSGYISYDKYGDFDFKYLTVYVNGEITGTKTLDQKDRIMGRSEIVKKDKHHTVTTSYKANDAIFSVREFEMDDKGQVIKDKFKAGSFEITNKFTYNDGGLVVSCTGYDAQNRPVLYTEMEIVKF